MTVEILSLSGADVNAFYQSHQRAPKEESSGAVAHEKRAEIILWFQKSRAGVCELERTLFIGHPSKMEIMSVRGKTAGAYKNAGSFQWTPGVKALTLVLIKALIRELKQTTTFMPLLEGDRGSLAASLDYALDKQPDWLLHMFGSDNDGNAYLRQLLLRSNSGMKRSGSVGISLNEQLFSPQSIKIYFRDVAVKHVEELDRLAQSIIDTHI